jgi:hypothetical protein
MCGDQPLKPTHTSPHLLVFLCAGTAYCSMPLLLTPQDAAAAAAEASSAPAAGGAAPGSKPGATSKAPAASAAKAPAKGVWLKVWPVEQLIAGSRGSPCKPKHHMCHALSRHLPTAPGPSLMQLLGPQAGRASQARQKRRPQQLQRRQQQPVWRLCRLAAARRSWCWMPA